MNIHIFLLAEPLVAAILTIAQSALCSLSWPRQPRRHARVERARLGDFSLDKVENAVWFDVAAVSTMPVHRIRASLVDIGYVAVRIRRYRVIALCRGGRKLGKRMFGYSVPAHFTDHGLGA